jgi:hypothetical protein
MFTWSLILELVRLVKIRSGPRYRTENEFLSIFSMYIMKSENNPSIANHVCIKWKKINFSFILLSNKYIIDAILLWYIKQKSFEQEGKASKKKKN